MRNMFAMALVAVTLFSSPVFAEDAITIDSSPAQIRTAQADLRLAIERKSAGYSHFSDDERKEIFARQDEVLALIEGKQEIADLGPDGKVALGNALAAVNASVARAEDNRMICERIKPVGSNRPQNKCISVGNRRRMREEAQRGGLRTDK